MTNRLQKISVFVKFYVTKKEVLERPAAHQSSAQRPRPLPTEQGSRSSPEEKSWKPSISVEHLGLRGDHGTQVGVGLVPRSDPQLGRPLGKLVKLPGEKLGSGGTTPE